MTLRQALFVIWKRKWIVLVAVAAAILAAGIYSFQQEPSYSSSTTLRLNSTVTAGVTVGEILGAPVDLDPALITSSTFLDPVAEALGVEPESLYGSVSSQFVDTRTATSHVIITTSGVTSAQARERVTAVADAYQELVESQLQAVRAVLEERRDAVAAQASGYQSQASANPGDSIAAANLSNALSALVAANNRLTAIDNAGQPVTVLIAAGPGVQTTPTLSVVLGIALICGLIVGIAAALIRDQFDDRLRDEQELQDLTGLASLGSLSYDRPAALDRNRLPAATSQRTPLNEGIRALRTTLQVILPPRNSSIVVTSVEPGDGKTFTSANLAVAWARAGKRVILVDGDLRRPSLGKYFPAATEGEGLTQLLRHASTEPVDTDQIDSRLVNTAFPGLSILPAGGASADPADLLALPATGEIVAHLVSTADIVIIDSPPSLLMADAALLGAHTDGVVLLTSIGRSLRQLISETAQALTSHGATLLGAVANRAHGKNRRAYSAYYGYGEIPDEETVSQRSASSDAGEAPMGPRRRRRSTAS